MQTCIIIAGGLLGIKMGRNGGKFPLFQFGSIISDTGALNRAKGRKRKKRQKKAPPEPMGAKILLFTRS